MCIKLPQCARQIDPCIRSTIDKLQDQGIKTILSCCGHEIYPKSIVIRHEDDTVTEHFSNVPLKNYNPNFDKRHNKYYKRDSNGFYFIPELSSL